jgi:hypothetical protein
VQITPAPATASSTLEHARAPICSHNAAARSGARPQTTISAAGRIVRIASTCRRACTPVPRIATLVASGRARTRVATADTAAVRMAVTAVASTSASRQPLSPSCSRTAPWWVCSPRARLSGTSKISFSANTRSPSSRNASISPVRMPVPSMRTCARGGCRHMPRERPASAASIAAMHVRTSSTASTSWRDSMSMNCEAFE